MNYEDIIERYPCDYSKGQMLLDIWFLLNILDAIGAQQDRIRYAIDADIVYDETRKLLDMFDAESANFIGATGGIF